MSTSLVGHEQRELVDSFTRPLDTLLPLTRLHTAPAGEEASWPRFAELGWLAAAASEALGGVGLGPVELTLMTERLGRCLASPSVVATILAAHLLEPAVPALAAALAAGEKRAAFLARGADGALCAVDARGAHCAIEISSEGIEIRELTEGKSLAPAITVWSVTLDSGCDGAPVFGTRDQAALANARLLLAAQAAGIAAASRDAAVDYAKLREQFGQPIGAFQAIKHRCADMAMQALAASDLVEFAAVALAQRRADASFLAAAALDVALRGALHNAAASIQIHGGIGFSAECTAHHFLKRARVLEAIGGGLASVRRAVLALAAASPSTATKPENQYGHS